MKLNELVRKLRHPFRGNPSEVGDLEVVFTIKGHMIQGDVLIKYQVAHAAVVDGKIQVELK